MHWQSRQKMPNGLPDPRHLIGTPTTHKTTALLAMTASGAYADAKRASVPRTLATAT